MCFSFVLSINFCHFLIALFFLWLGLVVFGAIICVIKFLDFLLFPAFYVAKVFCEVAFEFYKYNYWFHQICFVNFFWDWSKGENNLWDCGESIHKYLGMKIRIQMNFDYILYLAITALVI